MTRTFNENLRCPKCGHEHTAETDFERWMRNHPNLKSESGIVRFDLDVLLHRYKFVQDGKGDRLIQCMMFIEVKTFMAAPSPAQADTLSMLNQVLRNRRPNMHSNPRRQMAGQAGVVYSPLNRRNVKLFLFGGHLLQLDGTYPDNSERILWDNKAISGPQFLDLLRFERDPDDPAKQIDIRRRSQAFSRYKRLF